MTFEYRNAANDRLAVAPLGDRVWLKTTPGGCEVPPAQVEELVAGIRDAARQATGQPVCVHPEGYEGECPCTTGCDCCKAVAHAVDCPACDAGIVHTEHCPTPETHNWGCGCPTDRQQGIEATRAKLSTPCAYCGHSYNWHTLRGGCQVKAGEARCGCGAFVTPAVGQQDATQPTTDETEAHPPRAAWRIELRDAEGWAISGLVRPDRDEVARYLASRRKQRPDAEFRLVREDTTWTVEEDETR